MRVPKILLIDDEEEIRDCIRLLVGRAGKYDFDQAANGQEGLSKILSGDYDCVVSDIKMPGMDGVSMLKRIRNAGKDLPILFISAFADPDFELEVTTYGAVKLINKVDICNLGKCIEEALTIGRDTNEITANHELGEDFLKMLNNSQVR